MHIVSPLLTAAVAISRQVLGDLRQNVNPIDLIRPISKQQIGACLGNMAICATVETVACLTSQVVKNCLHRLYQRGFYIMSEISPPKNPSLLIRGFAWITGIGVSFQMVHSIFPRVSQAVRHVFPNLPHLAPLNPEVAVRLIVLLFLVHGVASKARSYYDSSQQEQNNKTRLEDQKNEGNQVSTSTKVAGAIGIVTNTLMISAVTACFQRSAPFVVGVLGAFEGAASK